MPELERMDGLQLARWGAAACAGGLTQGSAAKLAGVSRRHLQRLLAAHACDPFVARDSAMAQAVIWERQGGVALQEATSRALSWLREVSADAGAEPRVVAAALAASIQAGHRLNEAGSRRAKRLQPVAQQPNQNHFDLQGFLGQIALACEEVKALPPEQQEAGWEKLRAELKAEQQLEADDSVIDVEIRVDQSDID